MLPLTLLRGCVGSGLLVELKNGETLNGALVQCDSFMNLLLSAVIVTSRDGTRFWSVKEVYVRGNNIKYLRIPDEIIQKVKDEADQHRNDRPQSGHRGGRGGSRGGRGRGGGEGRGGHTDGRGEGRGGYHHRDQNQSQAQGHGDRGGHGGYRGADRGGAQRGHYQPRGGRGGSGGGDRGAPRGGRGRGQSSAPQQPA